MQDYSRVEYAILEQYLFTYQRSRGTVESRENMYVKLDGSYNVTKNRRTVRRGELDPMILSDWLQYFIDHDLVHDYSGSWTAPHSKLKFLDSEDVVWTLSVTEGLPAPDRVWEFIDYLDQFFDVPE